MSRLGVRLALHSGREALIRLILTAVAVAIGVAIILAVFADYHAFQVTNNRPAWENSQGVPASGQVRSAPRAELWNFRYDVYAGQNIERLDRAALGRGAPVPPGIPRLPGPGQYYASPALAALLRSVPRDELADRFPGRQIGAIGDKALTGPDELVIFVGYQPAKLAALPGTDRVEHIATAPARNIWSPFFRYAFAVGFVAFVFPVLILIGTATRLAASRREERYAALRLVGATPRQVSVIASVDAVLGALIGTLLGIGLFEALQPVLAGTALTSTRYFGSEVTPTALGYLAVLVVVPLASAIAALLSLRRVRISPLGVSRKVTPPAPGAWRVAPLLIGVILFVYGLSRTTPKDIGVQAYPGLIVILVGLVIGGPWLTAQAARLLARFRGGSALLAARRLTDNPKAAFRSVRGLVLAVFLGTVVAGLLPAVNSTTASPASVALKNVLLAGFTQSPVCGLTVNCSGGGTGGGGPGGPSGKLTPSERIGFLGLPPATGAALVARLDAIPGAHAYPVYSLPQDANVTGVKSGPGGPRRGPAPIGPGNNDTNAANAVISCASLRQLAVLGQCAPGMRAVQANTGNFFSDNPHYITMPIAGRSSPAATQNLSHLYLQLVMVRTNSAATLERVRTYLDMHTPLSQSGTAPRTFGEATLARLGVASTVQRLIYIAVALTLLVAACSLAVAAGGGLVERKRPFALLRVSGTPASALYRVVVAEAVFPLAAAVVVAAGVAYGISVLTVGKIAPKGTPVPVLGHVYYETMGAGLVVSLLVIAATLPLIGRMTGPASARFE
jgi:ABC-type antimicrobial peptide transport system permease subunit